MGSAPSTRPRPPAVADVDNVYLLVDAAGRVLITGPVASDAVAAGNPIPIGGDVDDTSPASASEGDRRTFCSTPEGNQIVELYKDNNALSPIAAMPGAGEVTTTRKTTASDSSVRVTVLTPTSGKKIRIISYECVTTHTTGTRFELYFDTGASLGSDCTKGIGQPYIDVDTVPLAYESWPDGAGPVGAVDAVLSLRTLGDIGASGRIVVKYREE